jgi:hypothetical protein
LSPRRARTFHLGDRYAAFSLRGADGLDASFAGTDVYVAARGVSNSVIPGVDEDELILTGANDIEVEQVTEVLLWRATPNVTCGRSRRSPWNSRAT